MSVAPPVPGNLIFWGREIADVGRVDVAEAVDLGAADETGIGVAAAQQSHDLDQPRAPGGAQLVGAVGHGVEHTLGWLIACDTAFEEADGVGGVGQAGDPESRDGQPHADEDPLMIGDLAGRRDDHHLLR